jgi:hypothetical protein
MIREFGGDILESKRSESNGGARRRHDLIDISVRICTNMVGISDGLEYYDLPSGLTDLGFLPNVTESIRVFRDPSRETGEGKDHTC